MTGINNDKLFSPDVLLHLPLKPLLKWQDMDRAIPNNNSNGINLDIEENSHFKRASYLKPYRDQTKHSFKNQRALRIL